MRIPGDMFSPSYSYDDYEDPLMNYGYGGRRQDPYAQEMLRRQQQQQLLQRQRQEEAYRRRQEQEKLQREQELHQERLRQEQVARRRQLQQQELLRRQQQQQHQRQQEQQHRNYLSGDDEDEEDDLQWPGIFQQRRRAPQHHPRRRSASDEEKHLAAEARAAAEQALAAEEMRRAAAEARAKEEWKAKQADPAVREAAAELLQRQWRGYDVRRQRIVERLRNLRKVEDKFIDVHRRCEERLADLFAARPYEPTKALRTRVLSFEEELTRLLLDLDSISSGSSAIVRNARKTLVGKVNVLLEQLDPIKRKVVQQVRQLEVEKEEQERLQREQEQQQDKQQAQHQLQPQAEQQKDDQQQQPQTASEEQPKPATESEVEMTDVPVTDSNMSSTSSLSSHSSSAGEETEDAEPLVPESTQADDSLIGDVNAIADTSDERQRQQSALEISAEHASKEDSGKEEESNGGLDVGWEIVSPNEPHVSKDTEGSTIVRPDGSEMATSKDATAIDATTAKSVETMPSSTVPLEKMSFDEIRSLLELKDRKIRELEARLAMIPSA